MICSNLFIAHQQFGTELSESFADEQNRIADETYEPTSSGWARRVNDLFATFMGL